MYILAPNQVAKTYPYSIGELRRDNPKTSFPRNPSEQMLTEWSVFAVQPVECPVIDHTKNVSEAPPALVNGTWTQVWAVTDASAEEIAGRNEQAAQSVRSQRDNLLTSTDWLVIKAQETGVAMDQGWATYRQALRDITDHVSFPYLADEDWPVAP